MYFKLNGTYADISSILEFMQLDDYDFSMLSFSDTSTLHYLVVSDEEGETIKLLCPEKNIVAEEIDHCEMRKLSTVDPANQKRVLSYTFIGNPNLFPFGVTFTDTRP